MVVMVLVSRYIGISVGMRGYAGEDRCERVGESINMSGFVREGIFYLRCTTIRCHDKQTVRKPHHLAFLIVAATTETRKCS